MSTELDFSDVLIKPYPTNLVSRKDVYLYRNFTFKYSNETLKVIPLMCANMDTVGTMSTFETFKTHGMFTTFHKFISNDEFFQQKDLLNGMNDYFAVSIGYSEKEITRLEELSKFLNFKCICIDVANGYMNAFVKFCEKVRQHFPNKIIIAGNVVCGHMTGVLIKEGKVDIVKVGIGGGSACTTRLKTGVGRPQLSTVLECSKVAHSLGAHVISDGGITCPGDVGKAFGAGADLVMIGGQFAGHDQNPGKITEENGQKYKLFYGMSSSHAMNKNYGGVNKYRTSEGRCFKIKYKGDLNDTIEDFLGGLRSLCTYTDSLKVKDLMNNVKFIKVNNQVNKSLLN